MNFPSIQDHGGIFGGGLNIKGIEKTYTVASGETIQAGDFIDFVNTKLTTIKKQKKTPNLFAQKEIINILTDVSREYSVVFIDTNKALIAYTDANDYGKLVVATLGEGSIEGFTLGTVYTFNSKATDAVNLIKLDTNKALLTYVDAGSSSAGIAVVVTVSGTTISLGSSYTFNASSTNSGFVRVIKLDNSNIFLGYASQLSPYARVLTISGTTISSGSTYNLNTTTNLQSYRFILLDTNKVLAVYKSSSDLSLLTRVITISGNSLTLNTEYTFLSSSITYFDYIEKLSNSSALVVYQYYTGSTYELRVAVLTISGTTVSIGSYLTISTNTSYWSAYALKFDTDKVILVYRTGGTYFTFCVATISGTSVTKGTALADIYYGSTTDFWGYVVSNTNVVIILSSYLYMLQIKTTDVLITSRKDVNFGYKPGATISVDYTTDEVFFILFQSATSGNYKIYGYLMDFVLQAKGIAKQSGTAGQQIKVMTL